MGWARHRARHLRLLLAYKFLVPKVEERTPAGNSCVGLRMQNKSSRLMSPTNLLKNCRRYSIRLCPHYRCPMWHYLESFSVNFCRFRQHSHSWFRVAGLQDSIFLSHDCGINATAVTSRYGHGHLSVRLDVARSLGLLAISELQLRPRVCRCGAPTLTRVRASQLSVWTQCQQFYMYNTKASCNIYSI